MRTAVLLAYELVPLCTERFIKNNAIIRLCVDMADYNCLIKTTKNMARELIFTGPTPKMLERKQLSKKNS
jgi:hypothetical protein